MMLNFFSLVLLSCLYTGAVYGGTESEEEAVKKESKPKPDMLKTLEGIREKLKGLKKKLEETSKKSKIKN
ncbi:hypothetical protein [Holospora undulata]|nr:hypothetical protein [Holospora undulata]